jgi:hypothetical protein
MKLLALLLAAAGLSGCVAYPYGAQAPYYAPGYYGQGGAYVVEPAASIYYDVGGYSGRGHRDWDRRDGSRRDRDRDGVSDRYDRRPYDPRR